MPHYVGRCPTLYCGSPLGMRYPTPRRLTPHFPGTVGAGRAMLSRIDVSASMFFIR